MKHLFVEAFTFTPKRRICTFLIPIIDRLMRSARLTWGPAVRVFIHVYYPKWSDETIPQMHIA